MRPVSSIRKKIRVISNKFREVADRNLQKYNLTAAQLEILVYLKCSKEEEIHQRQIEEWFQLKNPTVTGLLKRLEEKGFIVRRPNPQDRRYRVVELTGEGRQLLEQMWEEVKRAEDQIFGGFSEEQLTLLQGFLDRILENLSEENKEHTGGKQC